MRIGKQVHDKGARHKELRRNWELRGQEDSRKLIGNSGCYVRSIRPVIPLMAGCTKEAMIVGTHDIVDLPQQLRRSTFNAFPAHSYVATADFGVGEEKRAVYISCKEMIDIAQVSTVSSIRR
jgi:hypothetical protein